MQRNTEREENAYQPAFSRKIQAYQPTHPFRWVQDSRPRFAKQSKDGCRTKAVEGGQILGKTGC